jgi:hypothetical protein
MKAHVPCRLGGSLEKGLRSPSPAHATLDCLAKPIRWALAAVSGKRHPALAENMLQ